MERAKDGKEGAVEGKEKEPSTQLLACSISQTLQPIRSNTTRNQVHRSPVPMADHVYGPKVIRPSHFPQTQPTLTFPALRRLLRPRQRARALRGNWSRHALQQHLRPVTQERCSSLGCLELQLQSRYGRSSQ